MVKENRNLVIVTGVVFVIVITIAGIVLWSGFEDEGEIPVTTVPVSTVTSTPLPTPVSPISPVLETYSTNLVARSTAEARAEIVEIFANSAYEWDGVDLICSNVISDTAVYSEEPVTGTLEITVSLYDKLGNRLAFQYVPNFAVEPAGLRPQSVDDQCDDVYYDLYYTWDTFDFELMPGATYTETLRIKTILTHTTQIEDYLGNPLPDVVGWYYTDGATVTYYGPEEEVFLRTFTEPISMIKVYLPLVLKNAE